MKKMLNDEEAYPFEKETRAFMRASSKGGNFLWMVFKKEERVLYADECMQLMNTYGIPPEYVFFMALSHQFAIDAPGFFRLIEKQKEQEKHMEQCKGDS